MNLGEFEVWQLEFSEAFQSEYSMQWLDEKYVTPAELIRREQRDQWESENYKESKDRVGKDMKVPKQC